MGTITTLPGNARTLSAVRKATVDMAKRYGADEHKRLRAFGRAMRLMRDGASSAWAVQAARQEMRDGVHSLEAGHGPSAA